MGRALTLRLGARETAYLISSLSLVGTEDPGVSKLRAGILAKLTKAAVEPPGVNVRPLEDAFVVAGAPKAVRLAPGAYGRASKQAAAVGATPEDASALGRWLGHQRWLGGATLLTVLNKWHEWLPLALALDEGAERPRVGGLGGKNVGQDADRGGEAHPGGRRPGLGRR